MADVSLPPVGQTGRLHVAGKSVPVEVVDHAGESLTRLSLAWVLANPVVTSAIIGASRVDQLSETLGTIDYALDPALKAKLDDASHAYRWGDAAR